MSFKDECWMDVKGYESSYRVSDHGRIFSKLRNRVLKPYPNPKGYLLIDLIRDTKQVHRIVLGHFKEVEDMASMQVNHIDGNKTNNRLSNLEWCTNLENQRHSWANGRKAARGEKVGLSKLKENQVLEIIELLKEGKHTQMEISRVYGVSKSTIGKINTKKNWRWLWN